MRSRRLSRARLIITADDFGRDAACTVAIAESLAAGTITATSIMANGAHFAHACTLVRANGLADRIGVHLSLDEGPPLSREMVPYVDSNGNLCVRRSLMPLGSRLAKAVEAELAAQIDRVIASGIRPSHLDSHRHMHTAFPIARVVVHLAQQYRIRYVRPARNLAGRGTVISKSYKRLFNRYLRSNVETADYFGDMVDFYRSGYACAPGALIECMIHLDESPRGLDGRRLLNSEAFIRFLDRYELVAHGESDCGRSCQAI